MMEDNLGMEGGIVDKMLANRPILEGAGEHLVGGKQDSPGNTARGSTANGTSYSGSTRPKMTIRRQRKLTNSWPIKFFDLGLASAYPIEDIRSGDTRTGSSISRR